MTFINKFKRVIAYTPGQDQLIKTIEKIRGLYKPNKMIGRNLTFSPDNSSTDLLVFAAHADDDILGLGITLSRYSIKERIKIIFTTNGTADWTGTRQSWNISKRKAKKRAENRYKEAAKALALIGIPEENIFCLGYPDSGTHRYLSSMFKDIQMILQKFNPEKVYVHSIEGGHNDHDMTSYVVKTCCQLNGFDDVHEWAQYNPWRPQPIGTADVQFLPSPFHEDFKGVQLNIADEERLLKKKMLAKHVSQNVIPYFMQGEATRKADLLHACDELFEFCRLPKPRLRRIIKNFQRSLPC